MHALQTVYQYNTGHKRLSISPWSASYRSSVLTFRVELQSSLVCAPPILTFMRVQRQKGSNDCDVFALADIITHVT